MVEYLYNAIIVTSGESVAIGAEITEDDGTPITSGCTLTLYDTEGKQFATVDGVYLDDTQIWNFVIPAELTADKHGRYYYTVQQSGQSLCFKQPIYFGGEKL